MKAAVLLTFLSILTTPAFAAIPNTNYIDGVVTHVKGYTDTEVGKVKLTQGSNVTISSDNKINVATGTQTTAGVVKYGTIPTASTGTGEALIWVE